MVTPPPVRLILGPTPLPVHAVDPINVWTTYVFPVIGLATGVIAASAAVAALRGLLLAHKTYQLTKNQFEAAEAERNKKPRLVVLEQRSARNDKGEIEAIVPLTRGLNNVMLYMEVENEGNRKATNVSIEFIMEGIRSVGMDQGIAVTANGYTRNRIDRELAPGERTLIGIVNASAEPGTARVKWIARCNEGSFPQKDDSSDDLWGEIIIKLGQL